MSIKDNIQFIRSKDYKFLREIGQGGTGRTILIRDETINEEFVCKKYSTFYKKDQSEYYKYFIDEIKILHAINHRNIVRVFNYYLYPEKLTGYILMEYIEGQTIETYLLENPDKLEDVFIQLIEGFKYLEEKGILHRDIRPENILISKNGSVKIIDFGFGKKIEFDESDKSISLNWRYAVPEEFDREVYDSRTEIYFVGKLFEEILQKIENISFKYYKVVSKMILRDWDNRISSFFDVYRETIGANSLESEFTYPEKSTYQSFANNLKEIISELPHGAKYTNDISLIIRNLEDLHRNSLLEEVIQNNNKLVRIFINDTFKFYRQNDFYVSSLQSIIQLLKSVSDDKRKIIINNLWERLDSIPRYHVGIPTTDDLPF